jgi:hypothetical protein
MTRRITIKLAAPANDMVQEEIIKQVAFLSVDLSSRTRCREYIFSGWGRRRSTASRSACSDTSTAPSRHLATPGGPNRC